MNKPSDLRVVKADSWKFLPKRPAFLDNRDHEGLRDCLAEKFSQCPPSLAVRLGENRRPTARVATFREFQNFWCQDPHVLCSLVDGSHLLRRCVKRCNIWGASIFKAIPYIDSFFLGVSSFHWHFFIFLFCSPSHHRRHFRLLWSSLSTICSWCEIVVVATSLFSMYMFR